MWHDQGSIYLSTLNSYYHFIFAYLPSISYSNMPLFHPGFISLEHFCTFSELIDDIALIIHLLHHLGFIYSRIGIISSQNPKSWSTLGQVYPRLEGLPMILLHPLYHILAVFPFLVWSKEISIGIFIIVVPDLRKVPEHYKYSVNKCWMTKWLILIFFKDLVKQHQVIYF